MLATPYAIFQNRYKSIVRDRSINHDQYFGVRPEILHTLRDIERLQASKPAQNLPICPQNRTMYIQILKAKMLPTLRHLESARNFLLNAILQSKIRNLITVDLVQRARNEKTVLRNACWV